MRKLLRELRREFPFAKIEFTKRGHLRLCLPNGKTVLVASTPGCRHHLRHARADVRRQSKAERSQP